VNDIDPTEDYRDRVYVGRSRSADPEFSLEKAFEDAYEKAKGAGKAGPFQVLEIWVDGTNPLSDYKVAVKAGG
jgi:hypothetical protein